MQKDNSTFDAKVRLRRAVLAACPTPPVVLESHGGRGRLFERAWFKAAGGLVLEKDEGKAAALVAQRPTWRVYEGDSLLALANGVGSDVVFDVVDLDPYGMCWDYLPHLAQSARRWPDRWHLVVNDGGRHALGMGQAWNTPALGAIVARWGNRLFARYLDVCRELVRQTAEPMGFRVAAWHGYYCGHGSRMTYFWAALERRPVGPPGNMPGASGGGRSGGAA